MSSRSAATLSEPAIDESNGNQPAENLPVYGWLKRVAPAQPDRVDWTREVVRGKELRGDETRNT